MPQARGGRRGGFSTAVVAATLFLLHRLSGGPLPAKGDEEPPPQSGRQAESEPEKPAADIAKKRLEVMKEHALALRVTSSVEGWPTQLEPVPIFRYDDQTRGYVDGTVWRLGARGRPLAIITTELHPNYVGGGPRVVYDFLSLSPHPFKAAGGGAGWNSRGSAVAMKPLSNAPAPAGMPAGRLSQMKKLSLRFTATQDLEETDRVLVHLRRLPREIDRYVPAGPGNTVPEGTAAKEGGDVSSRADGGIFLFANGRNPAIVLLIETDGTTWTYGAGRLSAPSTLTLLLDDEIVWKVPPARTASSEGYSATNVPARFP